MLNGEDILPDNIAVYSVEIPAGSAEGWKPRLLEHHFETGITDEERQVLMQEIAVYLSSKEEGTVYSFFSPQGDKKEAESTWQLCCCRYNTDGTNGQVVVFSYALELVEDVKTKLFRVLETESFLKQNFEKVARLTRKEKEIIGFLSRGMNTREISGHTFTSVHTVKTHRRNIHEKLGIRNLSDLIRLADVFELTSINTSV